jgi:hypothetical protein
MSASHLSAGSRRRVARTNSTMPDDSSPGASEKNCYTSHKYQRLIGAAARQVTRVDGTSATAPVNSTACRCCYTKHVFIVEDTFRHTAPISRQAGHKRPSSRRLPAACASSARAARSPKAGPLSAPCPACNHTKCTSVLRQMPYTVAR